jgi:hypothetical protein
MTRFMMGFTAFWMVALLTASGIGTAIDKDARTADMPTDIKYEIQLTGVWPDRYYADAYDFPAPRSFYVSTYWTFEPSKYPLSPPVWVHHLNELTMKDVDYTVVVVVTR